MTDHRSDVIMLHNREGTLSGQPLHYEILRAVVGQLDQLGGRAYQFSPQATWPAQQWMIASTPFRMRLTCGRRVLGDLARVCATGEHAYHRRTLELNDARREAERRLQDIAACLHALQRPDTLPAERERQTKAFLSARSGLLEVVTEIRHMVFQWLPAGPDAI